MDGDPVDTTTKDKAAAEEASGGGDDDAQDYKLPGGPGAPNAPTEPAKRKSFWDEIKERRQKPYQKVPQDDKDNIPMKTFPPEKKGLPEPKGGEGTEKSSFIEGLDYTLARISLENQNLENAYP